MRQLLAVDWGTSSLRGALLASNARGFDARSFERAILTVGKGGFPAVFDGSLGEWTTPGGLRAIAGTLPPV